MWAYAWWYHCVLLFCRWKPWDWLSELHAYQHNTPTHELYIYWTNGLFSPVYYVCLLSMYMRDNHCVHTEYTHKHTWYYNTHECEHYVHVGKHRIQWTWSPKGREIASFSIPERRFVAIHWFYWTPPCIDSWTNNCALCLHMQQMEIFTVQRLVVL